ncbi:MAG: helix-turn-helix domain-containing protein, partial [Proteobacteria bacterium]|nr:helix-turn-helix domain-containing protein [Pseudomonadota bacterium]
MPLRPKIGWVRSIRKALGMTIKQLAKRLGVDPSRIVKIKTAEIRDAVTLHTLKMVAEKLDCSFVYALVPSTSLKEAIESKAEALA